MSEFFGTYVWPGAIMVAQSAFVMSSLLTAVAFLLYADR